MVIPELLSAVGLQVRLYLVFTNIEIYVIKNRKQDLGLLSAVGTQVRLYLVFTNIEIHVIKKQKTGPGAASSYA